MGPLVPKSLLLLACSLAACSFVEFERGPYAIRDVDVVYSVQEDATFFSWRLRKDARLSLVDFELWLDGDWQPIELADAPFPAEPYLCYQDQFWCFQYQVAGDYELPEDAPSPLRSIHARDGITMGAAERKRVVQRTFDVDPIALGHNEAIDPRRFDWFDENDVPLRRDYEWQFTGVTNSECDEPSDPWRLVVAPIGVEYSWTEEASDEGLCYASRPLRTDTDGVERAARLFPSAETTSETQRYEPPRQTSPVVWGLMLDLEIPNEDRCRMVKSWLIEQLEDRIFLKGQQFKLGVYTPVDPESGEELSGCAQGENRAYPFERMLRDAQDVAGQLAPTPTRVLWVFVNNVELPPPAGVLEQMALLALLQYSGGEGGLGGLDVEDFIDEGDLPPELGGLGANDDLPDIYTWAIGSEVFINLAPWNLTTGWRPIEDKTLAADIRLGVSQTLPFRTMLHDETTEVEVRLPAGVERRPHYFKVCDASPLPISALGNVAGMPFYAPDDVVPWPEFDDEQPYFTIYLPEQHLVPNAEYTRRPTDVVVEVCTAFCDGPFRRQGGDDFDSWTGSRSVCQWSR